jgi:hypothetical protein
MLQHALEDGMWGVMMVGSNTLNQAAHECVFSRAMDKGSDI